MMLPKWGTLLTYGRADVMRVFLVVDEGRTLLWGMGGRVCVLKVWRAWSCYGVSWGVDGVVGFFLFFVEKCLSEGLSRRRI